MTTHIHARPRYAVRSENVGEPAMNNGKLNHEDNHNVKENAWGFIRKTIVPLILMTVIPNVGLTLWYTAEKHNGSFLELYEKEFSRQSIPQGFIHMWTSIQFRDALCPLVLIAYCVWTLILMRLLPGRRVMGPVTPKGNTPVYVENGFSCYVTTIAAFVILSIFLKSHGLTPTVLYDRFDEMIVTLNAFSVLLCVVLYIKGHTFPSSSDCGSTGNVIFDFYWGTELYPRIFGFDVKVFTNCRFGMTVWPLLVLIHALKSYELHGYVDSMFVSMFLQMLYITKFFWWEAGYMNTLDIILDRAGFYICWGCMVVVPSSYASVSMYLVNQPVKLGTTVSGLILACGLACLYLNYMADLQKLKVRETNGNCLIWGKKPHVIRVNYRLENGEQKQSVLLLSGWWGISRHFNYLPEIMLALFWSLPALAYNLAPYYYVIQLTMILIHRTFRDDDKCQRKYGNSWKEYCRHVPYKIIPYLF